MNAHIAFSLHKPTIYAFERNQADKAHAALSLGLEEEAVARHGAKLHEKHEAEVAEIHTSHDEGVTLRTSEHACSLKEMSDAAELARKESDDHRGALGVLQELLSEERQSHDEALASLQMSHVEKIQTLASLHEESLEAHVQTNMESEVRITI